MNLATRSSLWESVAGRIRSEVGGKVLVVGARPGNFPDSLREHPRIIWWDSTHYSDSRMKELPHHVRWIVMTKWVDHHVKDRVRSIKPAGVQLLDWSVSSKEVTNLLRAVEEDPMIQKPTRPTNGHRFQGTISDWLRATVPEETLLGQHTRVKDEAARLVPAAKAAGLDLDADKLRINWNGLRHREYLRARKRAEEITSIETSLAPSPPSTPPAPPPSIPIVAHMEMTDPVTPKVCAEFLTTFALLRETLESVSLQLERMKAEFDYLIADRARLQVIARQSTKV